MSRPVHVLMIEDSAAQAQMILRQLEQAGGLAVEWVGCVGDALARLDAGGIDVVLSDLRLPDATGRDVWARLLPRAGAVPIVLMTGTYEDETLGLYALRQGAQDYILKSEITGKKVARALRYAIERKRSEEVSRASEECFRQIFANMSREIRTPMNGILGMTELALAAEPPPQVRDYLQMVKASADALLTVINDVLASACQSQRGSSP